MSHDETDSLNRPPQVSCPTCKKPVDWVEANSFRPFCSERCQIIDLGEWASESYRIAEKSSLKDQLDTMTEEELAEWISEQKNAPRSSMH